MISSEKRSWSILVNTQSQVTYGQCQVRQSCVWVPTLHRPLLHDHSSTLLTAGAPDVRLRWSQMRRSDAPPTMWIAFSFAWVVPAFFSPARSSFCKSVCARTFLSLCVCVFVFVCRCTWKVHLRVVASRVQRWPQGIELCLNAKQPKVPKSRPKLIRQVQKANSHKSDCQGKSLRNIIGGILYVSLRGGLCHVQCSQSCTPNLNIYIYIYTGCCPKNEPNEFIENSDVALKFRKWTQWRKVLP